MDICRDEQSNIGLPCFFLCRSRIMWLFKLNHIASLLSGGLSIKIAGISVVPYFNSICNKNLVGLLLIQPQKLNKDINTYLTLKLLRCFNTNMTCLNNSYCSCVRSLFGPTSNLVSSPLHKPLPHPPRQPSRNPLVRIRKKKTSKQELFSLFEQAMIF